MDLTNDKFITLLPRLKNKDPTLYRDVISKPLQTDTVSYTLHIASLFFHHCVSRIEPSFVFIFSVCIMTKMWHNMKIPATKWDELTHEKEGRQTKPNKLHNSYIIILLSYSMSYETLHIHNPFYTSVSHYHVIQTVFTFHYYEFCPFFSAKQDFFVHPSSHLGLGQSNKFFSDSDLGDHM